MQAGCSYAALQKGDIVWGKVADLSVRVHIKAPPCMNSLFDASEHSTSPK